MTAPTAVVRIACPTCRQRIQQLHDGRLIKHFDLRQAPRSVWCAQGEKLPAAVALGRIKTPHKAATARANGQKGGRPRKVDVAALEHLVRQWRADANGVTSAPVAEVFRDCAYGLERVILSAQENR